MSLEYMPHWNVHNHNGRLRYQLSYDNEGNLIAFCERQSMNVKSIIQGKPANDFFMND